MADLSYTPKVINGTQAENDELSPDSNLNSNPTSPSPSKTTFCLIDGHPKAKLLQASYSPSNKSTIAGFRPIFIKTAQMARKELSPHSLYPTLGIDTTPPQFRPQPPSVLSQGNQPDFSKSSQNECPVWYFFYGTLADSNVLARVLGLDGDGSASPAEISYRKARLRSGTCVGNAGWRLTTWGGKYKALVDFSSPSMASGEENGKSVEGSAYLVKTREEEDALRYYETDRYEAVRCGIELLDGLRGDGGEQEHEPERVNGLSFRIIG